MTTYVEFLTALGELDIGGVRRTYGYGETPPGSLNGADLPAAWIQEPSQEDEQVVFAGGTNWPVFKAVLIVAVCPVAQSRRQDVFVAKAEMIDAVTTALRGSRLASSRTTWSIRNADVVTVASIDYWTIVADVQASG